jgi:hypothetical protein
MPALEQYGNVDVQIGQRLFQQVPRKMRSDLWSNLTKKSKTGQDCVMKYPGLQAQMANAKTCSEIDKDVPRTFPDVPGFSDPQGQRRLVRILRSYSLFDPEVGYCQGMNFVAGLILRYLQSEAEAFGALCVVMRERNYRELFLPHMRNLRWRMAQLERVIPSRLAEKLREYQINPALYAPQWLLSCFANEMPTSFSARIIDVLLGERVVAAEVLIKVASRLLMRLESVLCSFNDFEIILKTIRNEPRRWDQHQLCTLLSEALLTNWTESERQILSSNLEAAEEGVECSADPNKGNQQRGSLSQQNHSQAAAQEKGKELQQQASGSTSAKATNKHSLFSSEVSLEIRRLK